MAFSFRSIFGKDKSDDSGSSMMSSPQAQQGGYPFIKSGQGAPSSKDVFLGASTPANGQPGGFQGASPFSPAVSVPTTGLTVEDILPSLPPEVVKQPGVSPSQPLQIPNELLERVLRSGQAALPLFEVFRVCPALFRAPISPQDPRMVTLPYRKLGGLAALLKKNGTGSAAPTENAAPGPFSPTATTPASPAPLHTAAQDPPAGAEPTLLNTTLFNASPFNMGGIVKPDGGVNPAANPVPQAAPPASAFFPSGSPASVQPAASLPPAVTNLTFAPSPALTSNSHATPFTAETPAASPAVNPFTAFGTGASALQPSVETVPPLPAFFGGVQAPAPAAAAVPAPAPPMLELEKASAPAPTTELPPSPFASFLKLSEPLVTPASPPVAAAPAFAPAPIPPAPVELPSPAGSGSPAAPFNPFFQAATSGSGNTSADLPAPGSLFTSFGQPASAPASTTAPTPVLPPAIFQAPAQAPASPPPMASAPLVPASPWAVPTPASSPVETPAHLLFPEAPVAPAGMNPFDRIRALPSAPVAPVEPPQDFAPSPAVQAQPPATPPTLFGGVSPGMQPVILPHQIPQAPAPPSPAFEPARAEAMPAATAPETISLSLASVVAKCSEWDIGNKPELIPAWVQVTFPVAMIAQKLATGQATVTATELLQGLDPEFRMLINPRQPDLMIELPINDIFHALPSPAAASAPAAPSMEMARPPAAPPASDLGAAALDSTIFLKPQSLASSPENQAALPSLFAPAPAAPRADETTTSKLPTGVPWPFEVNPPPAKAENAFSAPPESLLFPSASADPPALPPSFELVPHRAPEAPAKPLFEPTPKTAPLPASAPPTSTTRSIHAQSISFAPGLKAEITPAPVASVPVPVRPAPAKKAPDRNKQLLLRVLLSTEDDLELADVIRLTGALPGVSAAVCLDDGEMVGFASNHTQEAENFIAQATQIYSHLQPLIQLTGIMDTETLSMKSDHLMASFSLQGELVLGVLHDPGKNEPTLRERITLIARELKSVVSPSS